MTATEYRVEWTGRIQVHHPIILPEMAAEPIYCFAQTYRATRLEPAEYCMNEVADYGDLCSKHDEADRADADYDNYQESLRDDA